MLEIIMKEVLKKLGLEEIVHPIFYNCPIGLRYEIGIGQVYDSDNNPRVEYINNALLRALTLYKHGMSNPSIIMWEVYPDDMHSEEILLKEFKERVSSIPPQERTESKVSIDGDIVRKVRFYWDLKRNQFEVKELFKEIIIGDLGGFSELVSSAYVFDVESNIMLHMYDDRGMDIVAEKKETIFPIYQEYNAWILNYDRERIDSIFK